MSHHARHSPSRAKRDLACAAAASREALLTPSPSGPAAAWGTDSHWILEQAILADTPCTQIPVPDVPPYEEFSADDWENKQLRAQEAFAYVKRVQANTEGPVAVRAEARVYPGRWIGVEDDMDGSVDITLVANTMLEIIDYKSGYTHVDATDPQLKLYALGMALEYYKGPDVAFPFSTIRCTIVQPVGEDPERIRSVDYTLSELYEWLVNEYKPALDASNGPDPAATPTDEGCKWCECNKQNTCRELAEVSVQQITQVKQPFSADPHIPEISSLSDTELRKILDAVPLFENWIRNVKEHVTDRLKKGETFPGYKLVRGRSGNTTWKEKDDNKVRESLKNRKLKIDVYAPRVTATAPQILKAVEGDAKKLESVKKLTHRPEGGLKLAPDSSKSPAVKGGTGEAFGITDLPATGTAVTETPEFPETSAAFSCLQ